MESTNKIWISFKAQVGDLFENGYSLPGNLHVVAIEDISNHLETWKTKLKLQNCRLPCEPGESVQESDVGREIGESVQESDVGREKESTIDDDKMCVTENNLCTEASSTRYSLRTKRRIPAKFRTEHSEIGEISNKKICNTTCTRQTAVKRKATITNNKRETSLAKNTTKNIKKLAENSGKEKDIKHDHDDGTEQKEAVKKSNEGDPLSNEEVNLDNKVDDADEKQAHKSEHRQDEDDYGEKPRNEGSSEFETQSSRDESGRQKCSLCQKVFISDSGYMYHLKLHQVSSYPCSECKFIGHKITQLNRHLEKAHGLKAQKTLKTECSHAETFACTQCEKTFVSERNLQSHLRIHDNGPLQCPHCPKQFLSQIGHDVHVRLHTGSGLQRCDVCSYVTGSHGRLKAHITQVHNKQTSRLCDICGRGFYSITQLRRHKESTHMRDEVRDRYQCPHCDHKTHCSVSLKAHIKNLHSSDQPKFSCNLCGVTLKYRESLNLHLKRHSSVKSYQCSQCNFTAVCRKDVQAHIKRIHLRVTYQCEHCSKSFNDKGHLVRHRIIHTGEKRFACHLCNYRCNVQSNLSKHLLTVHKTKLRLRTPIAKIYSQDVPEVIISGHDLNSITKQIDNDTNVDSPLNMNDNVIKNENDVKKNDDDDNNVVVNLLEVMDSVTSQGCEMEISIVDQTTGHMASGTDPSHVTQHTDHVTQHTDHVTQHADHVTRHADHVTRYADHVTQHADHVTQHDDHVTQHADHVTQHADHVTQYADHVTLSNVTPDSSGITLAKELFISTDQGLQRITIL